MDATEAVDRALAGALPLLQQAGLTRGSRVLVGLSGGQDSLALAHALCRGAPAHGWQLVVVHVDHGIRDAGPAEAAALARLCGALGVAFRAVPVAVPHYAREARLNRQAAARYARYQCFATVAAQEGAWGVLVAHTADDVAETLVLHLLRGAGLDGLSGMPLVQTLPVAALGPPAPLRSDPLDTDPSSKTALAALRVGRPLLTVPRATTGAYCAEHGLEPFQEPPSDYARNRVRDALLPLLEAQRPGARAALARAAAALAEERQVVEAAASAAWDELARRDGAAVVFDLATWTAQPVALQRRLLRRVAAELSGSGADWSANALDAALAAADLPPGHGVDLPHGLRLERADASLRVRRFERRQAAVPPEREAWLLDVPGELTVEGIGRLRAEPRARWPANFNARGTNEAWLDRDAVRGSLSVRFRQRGSGERFWPLGMSGPKRLQDFFVDSRVPKQLRDAVPLVLAADDIVWVAGLRIAHFARLTERSRAALHLRFEPYRAAETASSRGSLE